MAHQFLDRPYCRTPHHQVRAERVTQDVHAGRYTRVDSRSTAVFSSTLNTANTLFTVFGDVSCKCSFNCCTLAFVIASSSGGPIQELSECEGIDSSTRC